MKTVRLEREVAVVAQTDVVVVGGGPAGIAAAVAAARAGAGTILIERYGFLGGSSTASLVGPFMTAYSLDGTVQLVRGVFEELVQRMAASGGAIHPSQVEAGTAYSGYIRHGHRRVTPFHPEVMKSVAGEMCVEAGVELLLHTTFVEPILEAGAVRGCFVLNKAGLQALSARVVVDASADGDVAFRAGAPTVKGRAGDGLMQPMTLFFRVTDVDREAIEAYRRQHPDETLLFASVVEEGRRRGEFTIPRDKIGIYLENDGMTWRVNTTRILGADGTDPQDLTRAEFEGRRQMWELLDFLRRRVPGFSRCRLVEVATQVGVRETRHVVGEYTLTAEDLAGGRAFPDVIAMAGYPIDIHDPKGTAHGFAHGLTTANAYTIPYRCLVPRGVDGLLVAGRCISATHEAAGAIRVMPPCFATGHAAGAAAALATRSGVAPRHVDVQQLQALLRAQGAYLG